MRRSKRKPNGEVQLLNEDGVIYQIVSVQKNGLATNSRPRLQINGAWLPELGFVNGALIQTLPETDGFVFNLFNENVNYSDLYHSTKEQGGTLIRLYLANEGTRNNEPTLVTTGKHLLKGGLNIGDALIAKCEYGCIRVRKVVGNVRLIYVARTKKPYTGEPVPYVFLMGDWMSDMGFTPDTLMTVSTEPDCITFTAYDKEIIYSEIVKHARQNKMKLIQVSTKDGSPLITLTGSCVADAGFSLGDIFAANYEYGIIKLQKLDPQMFGFPNV